MPVYHLEGPSTRKVSRAEAEAKLLRHPALPREADYDLWDQGGRWVAAWHQAAPFGQPADDDEESPGPKSEGPDDTAPEPESPDESAEGGEDAGGEDKPPVDGEEGPPKDKKDKGEKEDVKLDHEIYDLLQKIVVALGISDGGPEDSPVPGEDIAPPAPPAAPGPLKPPGGDQEAIKHERALKPGEAPPGTTPVGAPAFASVEKHPWKDLLSVENGAIKPKVASFFIEESWPEDRPVAEFETLARRVAHGTGFKIKQTKRDYDEDGNPTVKALISAH